MKKTKTEQSPAGRPSILEFAVARGLTTEEMRRSTIPDEHFGWAYLEGRTAQKGHFHVTLETFYPDYLVINLAKDIADRFSGEEELKDLFYKLLEKTASIIYFEAAEFECSHGKIHLTEKITQAQAADLFEAYKSLFESVEIKAQYHKVPRVCCERSGIPVRKFPYSVQVNGFCGTRSDDYPLLKTADTTTV